MGQNEIEPQKKLVPSVSADTHLVFTKLVRVWFHENSTLCERLLPSYSVCYLILRHATKPESLIKLPVEHYSSILDRLPFKFD